VAAEPTITILLALAFGLSGFSCLAVSERSSGFSSGVFSRLADHQLLAVSCCFLGKGLRSHALAGCLFPIRHSLTGFQLPADGETRSSTGPPRESFPIRYGES